MLTISPVRKLWREVILKRHRNHVHVINTEHADQVPFRRIHNTKVCVIYSKNVNKLFQVEIFVRPRSMAHIPPRDIGRQTELVAYELPLAKVHPKCQIDRSQIEVQNM